MLLSADVGCAAMCQGSLGWPRSLAPDAGFAQYLPLPPSPTVESGLIGPFQVAGQADEGLGEVEAAIYPPAPGSDASVIPPAVPVEAAFPPPPPPPILLRHLVAARKQQSELFLEDEAGNTWSSIQGPVFDQAFLIGPEGGRAEDLHGPPAEGPFDPPAEAYFGPPTPEEMAVTPRVPWTTDYTVNSTLAAGEISTSFRIPVGPVTNLIKLAVRPEDRDDWEGGPRPPAFKVDQIYLMGPNGKVLAAIAGVAYVSEEAGQSLLVTIHGAPRGGELVVRVIQTDSFPPIDDGGDPSPPGGGGEAPPSSSWSPGPFEFNVQRSDASPSPKDEGGRTFASVGTVGAGTSYVIYLPTATQERLTTSSTAGGISKSEDGGGAESGGLVADANRSAERATGPDEVEIADEEEAPSVFLGPLVSRTAAALGPALATSTDDPTPSTARGGRSGPDAADVLGDHDLGLYLGFASSRARRAAADRAEAVADREGGGDDLLASLRGAGGVPILVGGLGRNDARKEAEALAENLQRQAAMDELVVDALEADSELEPDPRRSEFARAGLATRAVGFLIGLGLATGPLYPDLVAFARKKLVRKSRHARRRKTAR